MEVNVNLTVEWTTYEVENKPEENQARTASSTEKAETLIAYSFLAR